VSAGVVLAGLAIHFTAWNWIDPITSLAITLMIAGRLVDAEEIRADGPAGRPRLGE
jgi:Co/Zn/Cd efflux system component